MIIIVGGPCGCGKTTIANELSYRLNIPFIEGDELHSPANIAKMTAGEPLNDEDRWDWLKNVAETAHKKSQESPNKGAVASCSALKKTYRDFIRKHTSNEKVVFVFVELSEKELESRVAHRINHFMKADMVASQLRDMEVPKSDEENCIVYHNYVDIAKCTEKLKALL